MEEEYPFHCKRIALRFKAFISLVNNRILGSCRQSCFNLKPYSYRINLTIFNITFMTEIQPVYDYPFQYHLHIISFSIKSDYNVVRFCDYSTYIRASIINLSLLKNNTILLKITFLFNALP